MFFESAMRTGDGDPTVGDLSLIFLIMSLFCGVLLSGESATAASAALLAGSVVTFFLWLAVRGRIRLSILNALQGLMLAELLLPLTAGGLVHFWGNYLSFVCAAVSFLAWSNLVRPRHRAWISGTLVVYALILVGQIVWRAVEITQQGIPTISYKAFMVVPFGGSNYLGGPLLILFFLFLCIKGREVSTRLSWLVLAALLLGMILIRSRATFVALFCTIVVYVLSRARLGGARVRVMAWTGLALLLTVGGFVVGEALVRDYGSLLVGVNVVSSGRVFIFKEGIDAFLGRPWFGTGLGNSSAILGAGLGLEYNVALWRTHNFVMDLLMFTGVVGAIIQSCVYVVAGRGLRIRAACSPWAAGALFALIATLIDGLAEANVLTYRVDALLWTVIGIGYALSAHDNVATARPVLEARNA